MRPKQERRKGRKRDNFWGTIRKRVPEALTFTLFVVISLTAIVAPLWSEHLSNPKLAPLFNALLSVGTGGIVSFTFYYIVNVRSERKRRLLIFNNAREVYRDVKHDIAWSILHASQKGGRSDLYGATSETIDLMLTVEGFRDLFDKGREGHEGFHAFENEMSSETPEFNEIVFNLKVFSRSAERIIDNGLLDDEVSYGYFSRIGSLIERIERNGAGYDESKLLCRLIWQMFSGWSVIDGRLGYDPIERRLAELGG